MNQIPSPNLLPLSRISDRRRDHAFKVWLYALIVLVLLVVVPSVLMSLHLRAAKPENTEHLTRFVNDLNELQATLPMLKKQVAELESASKSQELAKLRIQWNTVLNQLAKLTTENIRIHSFDSSINRQQQSQSISLSIQIHSKTLSQAREFLVILESSQLFDSLNMADSRRTSSDPSSPINSTINAVIIAQQPQEPKP
jgi:uncharacterized membrane-anchored protein YhcB (DUF1043 family)